MLVVEVNGAPAGDLYAGNVFVSAFALCRPGPHCCVGLRERPSAQPLKRAL